MTAAPPKAADFRALWIALGAAVPRGGIGYHPLLVWNKYPASTEAGATLDPVGHPQIANLATGLVGASFGEAALQAHLLSRKAGACAWSLLCAQRGFPPWP